MTAPVSCLLGVITTQLCLYPTSASPGMMCLGHLADETHSGVILFIFNILNF